MDKLFIKYDAKNSLEQIHIFFGKEYNLKKKIFSNDLDFIKEQKENELLVVTTRLSFDEIENSLDIKKLCVVALAPQIDVLNMTADEALSLNETSEIRRKYGAAYYTDSLSCKQNFILDKNNVFGFIKAAFVFNNEEDVDVDSYKYGGYNFVGIVGSA